MFSIVYRTHWEGRRLPAKEFKARGYVLGDLQLHERAHMSRIDLAQLVGPDGSTYVIPPLDRARTELRGGWLHIVGDEVHARPGTSIKNIKSTRNDQEWWCRPLGLRGRLLRLPVRNVAGEGYRWLAEHS